MTQEEKTWRFCDNDQKGVFGGGRKGLAEDGVSLTRASRNIFRRRQITSHRQPAARLSVGHPTTEMSKY